MTFKQWFTQEYDRDIEKRVKNAVRISMSEKERAQTRDFLIRYAHMHPVRTHRAQKSTWLSWSLHPYPLIAGLLIVTLGGSSAGAASLAEHALPGDLLYPIKVHVNEEVRAALATTPEEKAIVAIERAERRIDELNTLATRGSVPNEVRTEIDARIDEHVHDAEEETNRVDDNEKERRLVAMLRVHENLIAESEIGGGEQEVTFASVMAADAVPTSGSVEPNAMMAVPAEETATMAMQELQVARMKVEESMPEVVAIPAPEERSSKEKRNGPEMNPSGIKRQMKAAEQRIQSLEKLVSQNNRRVVPDALVHTQNELTAAQDAYAEGKTFFENGQWGDAAVRFNAAVRIAIDAREFLADAPKTEDDDKKDDSRRSGRSREREDD